MNPQLLRILIACIGIVITTLMYQPFELLYTVADSNSVLLFYGLLAVTFLVALIIELIPFSQRLTPSWKSLGFTLVIAAVMFFLHSRLIPLITGFTPFVEALVSSRWMAPMAGAIFGTLVGKSLKG